MNWPPKKNVHFELSQSFRSNFNTSHYFNIKIQVGPPNLCHYAIMPTCSNFLSVHCCFSFTRVFGIVSGNNQDMSKKSGA